MFKTLVQHPGVARPFLRKGVHYFDKSYDRGPRWYRGHFPLAVTSRLRRRGGRPADRRVEPVLHVPPARGERIARDLPGVRLMVLLRDPVERAYSGHSHELARGFESLSFEEAVDAEPERLAGQRERMLAEPGYDSPDWQHHAYVTRGQYIDQLEALEALVGSRPDARRGQRGLLRRPGAGVRAVCDFLGLRARRRDHASSSTTRGRGADAGAAAGPADATTSLPYDERLARWWGTTPSWRR